MIIGACTVRLSLRGISSLKEKRHILKPMLHQLRQRFEVAVAEVDANDQWHSAILAIVTVANDDAQVYRVLENAVRWINLECHDVDITDWEVELR